jgi:ORF6N domain
MAKLLLTKEIKVDKIYSIRGKQVMLGSAFSPFYAIKRINVQVLKNEKCLPTDFMFQLTKIGFEYLKSQIATLSLENWGRKENFALCFRRT